jgi:hypothetical protein
MQEEGKCAINGMRQTTSTYVNQCPFFQPRTAMVCLPEQFSPSRFLLGICHDRSRNGRHFRAASEWIRFPFLWARGLAAIVSAQQ